MLPTCGILQAAFGCLHTQNQVGTANFFLQKSALKAFFTEDILPCHLEKHTLDNNINEGLI